MSEIQEIAIPCGDIHLEGVAHLPSGSQGHGSVVVCHPHPLYGGDMDNHVVEGLCVALAESGVAALRFNFRGVGGSGGRYEEGSGQEEDVLAALAAAKGLPGVDSRRQGLAGYSFGAVVGAMAASMARDLRALVLVSPPLAALGQEALAGLALPKLILSGEKDPVAPPEELQRLAEKLGQSCEVVILPGVNHFWWRGFETAAARAVAFFKKHLGPGK